MKHLKLCKYCGRIHEAKLDCGYKPKYFQKKGNDIDKFHWSKQWEKMSLNIRRRDNFLCLICLEKKIFETKSLSVHHIDSLVENWERRLDEDNLITLCRRHHEDADRGKISKKKLFNLVKLSQNIK